MNTIQSYKLYEMADVETKASKSDKNVDEDRDHPSINAEDIIQSVFAPDTDNHIVKRRKVNKVAKKHKENSAKVFSNWFFCSLNLFKYKSSYSAIWKIYKQIINRIWPFFQWQ